MNPAVQILGWAIIHALWQDCLLVLLTALGGLFLAGRSRHRLNGLVLLLCLLLPAMTAWDSQRPLPARSGQAQVEPAVVAAAAHALAPAASDSRPLLVRLEAFLQPRLPLLVVLWALGAGLMALRLGGGYALSLRWKRQATPSPRQWQDVADALAKRMGIRRPVPLLLAGRGGTPLAMGLLKPVVLVPIALLTSLSPAYLEALLAHELAHVRRADYLGNLLQGLAETLLFFHPAIWWLSARLRAEREILADQLAAEVLGDPQRLAQALNALDDLQPGFLPPLFPALAARGGSLSTRIERLLSPRSTSGSPWGFLACLVIPFAVFALRAAAPDRAPISAPPEAIAKLDALAAKEGLDPQLLRSMAWVESGFNAKAKSPIGATGLLQVMPETARRYGAKDLDDPAQVMAAGAKYLRVLLDRYQGDVQKAVAAYNCGEKALDEGRITQEATRYRALVLDVLAAKAVQPETPPAEGEVTGTFRRSPNGKGWTLSSRVSTSGGYTLDVLPAGERADGKGRAAYVAIRGGLPEPRSGEWTSSRPKVVLDLPEGAAVLVRGTDLGSGRVGEASLLVSGHWQTFAFRMEKPKP